MANKRPFCHRLSTVIPPQRSNVLIPAGTPTMQATFSGIECFGMECANFVAERDERGHPTGNGMCGDPLQAIASARIASALEAIEARLAAEGEEEPVEVEPVEDPPAAA